MGEHTNLQSATTTNPHQTKTDRTGGSIEYTYTCRRSHTIYKTCQRQIGQTKQIAGDNAEKAEGENEAAKHRANNDSGGRSDWRWRIIGAGCGASERDGRERQQQHGLLNLV